MCFISVGRLIAVDTMGMMGIFIADKGKENHLVHDLVLGIQ